MSKCTEEKAFGSRDRSTGPRPSLGPLLCVQAIHQHCADGFQKISVELHLRMGGKPVKMKKQPCEAPSAPAYPRSAPAPFPQQAHNYGPPPPYNASYAHQQPAPYPAYSVPGQQQQYYASFPPPPPPQTVIHQGGFDGGARFDGGSRPVVPPPPPGHMPNASQLAAAYGHNVMVTQGKENFFTGSKGAGATFF